MMKKNGFTLIELIVTIAIIAVLSGVILFSITQYINKGKDSNIAGNLAVLIPAGEVYYNYTNSYSGFCNSTVVTNAFAQMPPGNVHYCVGDSANSQAWAACVKLFSNTAYAYCVDSRGMKKDKMPVASCTSNLPAQCP
jgi:prepilin-type N-terminal cleavage/methylation domain-containing protein